MRDPTDILCDLTKDMARAYFVVRISALLPTVVAAAASTDL